MCDYLMHLLAQAKFESRSYKEKKTRTFAMLVSFIVQSLLYIAVES